MPQVYALVRSGEILVLRARLAPRSTSGIAIVSNAMDRSNLPPKRLAILSFVLSCTLLFPFGIICGAIALKRMDATGDKDGRSLAIAAILIGSATCAYGAIWTLRLSVFS